MTDALLLWMRKFGCGLTYLDLHYVDCVTEKAIDTLISTLYKLRVRDYWGNMHIYDVRTKRGVNPFEHDYDQ